MEDIREDNDIVEASAPVEHGEAGVEQTDADPEQLEAVNGVEENPNMHWYIIHTYSGFENKVSESLRTRAEAFGFAHRLGQI